MDHDVVVRQKMTERYLLNELEPEARDEFEEHFFVCPECAMDVRAASAFVERSKAVLATQDDMAEVTVPESSRPRRGWLDWLRPNIAAPVIAGLLAIVGVQNLGPKKSEPVVLHWTSLNVASFAGEDKVIKVTRGSEFLLFVRVTPDRTYTSYQADLYNPENKLEWSRTFPASESQDQWPLLVPAADRKAGTYTLAVQGITSAGQHQDAGRASFDLQFDK